MNNPATPLLPTTRREFLRMTGSGLGLLAFSAYAPAFLTRAAAASVPAPQRDRRILVLVQMAGGNDGLNTVIPFTDSKYYALRPTLGLRDTPDAPLPRINDDLAWNPGAAPLAEMLKNGKLAVIQNVGYPNPNRSHFRSMEIWETASDSEKYLHDGWVGRYLDNCCGGAPEAAASAAGATTSARGPSDPTTDPLAIHSGAVLPTSFLASKPQTFFGLDAVAGGRGGARGQRGGRAGRFGGAGGGAPEMQAPPMSADDAPMMMQMNAPMRGGTAPNNGGQQQGGGGQPRRGGRGQRGGRGPAEPPSSAIELLEDFATTPGANDTENFLRHTLMDALVTERRVQQILNAYQSSVAYPGSQLGQSLRRVAALIASNLGTRVYFVTLGGFDTHSNQTNTHQRLLGELSNALVAFQRDLDSKGLSDQVLTMTFSEFGRRPYENIARGTDHGTSAPLFVMGSKINVPGGVLGAAPNLNVPDGGDLDYKVDFRQVYSTVLRQWLDADPSLVLGGRYSELPIFSPATGASAPVRGARSGPVTFSL